MCRRGKVLGVIKGILREKSCENVVYAVTYGMRVNLNHIVTLLHMRKSERGSERASERDLRDSPAVQGARSGFKYAN